MKNTENTLRIGMGIIFASAAVYRIFNYQEGVFELGKLGISAFFVIPVILFELTISACFLLNKKVKMAALVGCSFLVFAIVLGIFRNFSSFVGTFKELFVFDATPTDILLHLIYIGALLFLVFKVKSTK